MHVKGMCMLAKAHGYCVAAVSVVMGAIQAIRTANTDSCCKHSFSKRNVYIPDVCNAGLAVQQQLTQGGKCPDSICMVLSIEVSDLLASFGTQAIQEGASWMVHHLGQRPQRIGNVACTELFHVGHCSTCPMLSQFVIKQRTSYCCSLVQEVAYS